MTRNWIATASRALRMVGPGPARPRRHRMNPQLESLERRLSLSLSGAGTPTPMLNPQPLPPYAPPRPPIIGGGPTEDVVRKAGSDQESGPSPNPCFSRAGEFVARP
jgi:hypothetical protein